MRALLLLLCLFLGCTIAPSQKPLVIVTIPPYADLTRQIVGDFAEIKIFVPPGANPHIYEPTPHQVSAFAKAKLWFRYGDPIEEKVVPFLREHRVIDVDLSEGFVHLSGCCHDHADRHLWLDPKIANLQAKMILEAACQEWPNEREKFVANYEKLSSRLRELDAAIASRLSPLKGTYLLLSHPALGYFCHTYALHQLSIEHDGKEPLPQQIAETLALAANAKVKVVLVEPQYSTKGAALMAEKLKVPTATIDPYSADYFGTLSQITDTILSYYGD